MIGMLCAHILYAKIINAKYEAYRSPFVGPKSWCKFALCISFFVEKFFKELLVKDASGGKAIHAMVDLHVDVTVFGHYVFQIVVVNEVVRQVTEFESHILISLHWIVEIKVFGVD